MKQKSTYFAVTLMVILTVCIYLSANCQKKAAINQSKLATIAVKPSHDRVLTAEEQKTLTPDAVLQNLKEGNKRFINNNLTYRDHSAMVRKAAAGQYPKAVVISCIDSRVPVEDLFDKGIGDLFVGRVAGNFVNEDLLGSLEYSCKVAGAKLVVVLGHGSCGAIKAAIDTVKMGNITAMLTKIQPAVAEAQNFAGEKTSKNYVFVNYVARKNVLHTIEIIRTQSPILKEMEEKGEIKIVGAFYDLKTGEVAFF
jgi:carbonic anhydrase